MYFFCEGKTKQSILEMFCSSPKLLSNAFAHGFFGCFLWFFSHIIVVAPLVTIFHVVISVGTSQLPLQNSIILENIGHELLSLYNLSHNSSTGCCICLCFSVSFFLNEINEREWKAFSHHVTVFYKNIDSLKSQIIKKSKKKVKSQIYNQKIIVKRL